jgi:F-type H+-transporting ATPase subunit a
MADAISHIKDSYYFEVPKFLWRPKYLTLEDVPGFLTKAHPEASVAEFEEAMSGKILIPQPFGATLKNLYEKESGFAVSKFMVMELVAAILLIAIFVPLARRITPGEAPKGRGWNLFESFLMFMRDQVAKPAIGEHDADRFLPLLWTMFFFILTCNLLGLVPWLGSATGALATTGAMALVTFATVIIAGMIKLGPIGFWKAQVPHGVPLPLIPLIFPIEVLGLVIKHTILAVRLLANMMAGHLVLAVVVGFIAMSANSAAFWGVMPASVLGATALNLLELFVAFLQAYIFTFLSALFIGMAVHPH